MTRKPIYLYRIDWADVHPQQTVHKDPLIAGGCHDAREARRLMTFALGSRHFQRTKRVKGIPVIRSVRRIGPDTPADRLALEQIGPSRGRLHLRTVAP